MANSAPSPRSTIEIHPLTSIIGAEIEGIDLAEPLDACLASLDFIRRATASSPSSHARQPIQAEPVVTEGKLGAYRIVREIGSLAAALGGLDGLVFTGGIGQHSATIRSRVCENLAFLGLNPESSTPANPNKVLALPSQEELQIARHTRVLLRS